MLNQDALSIIHGPLIAPGNYPMEWLKSAMVITGSFEGSTFNTVTGDFDGQGISAGVLQWNYGQGSLQTKILQPYIAKMGSQLMDSYFPSPVSITSTMTTKQAVAYARKHMLDGKKLRPTWQRAWGNFLSQSVVQEIQMSAASSVGSRAFNDAISNNLRSKRAFCWFFDVYVQNGSLKGIKRPELSISQKIGTWIKMTLGDVPVFSEALMPFPVQDEYTANIGMDAAVDPINRKLWQQNEHSLIDDEEGIILFNWMMLRVVRNQWATDVISRKGTIAHKVGYVHGHRYDLIERLS